MLILNFPKSQAEILGDRFTLIDCLTDVAEPTQYQEFDSNIISPFSPNDDNRYQMIERMVGEIWSPGKLGSYILCFDPMDRHHAWLVEDAIEGATALAQDSYVLCNRDICGPETIKLARARWKIARRIERKFARGHCHYQFPRH